VNHRERLFDERITGSIAMTTTFFRDGCVER
jgi:hypothetical protein